MRSDWSQWKGSEAMDCRRVVKAERPKCVCDETMRREEGLLGHLRPTSNCCHSHHTFPSFPRFSQFPLSWWGKWSKIGKRLLQQSTPQRYSTISSSWFVVQSIEAVEKSRDIWKYSKNVLVCTWFSFPSFRLDPFIHYSVVSPPLSTTHDMFTVGGSAKRVQKHSVEEGRWAMRLCSRFCSVLLWRLILLIDIREYHCY